MQSFDSSRYVGDTVVTAYLVPLSLPTQVGSKLKQKLFDFARGSDVAVGATVELEFVVSAEALALYDLTTGDLVSAPGEYELVFDSGDGVKAATLGLTVTGTQAVVEPFPKA